MINERHSFFAEWQTIFWGKTLASQVKHKNGYIELSPELTAIQMTFLTCFPG